jgi:uncharacterized protein YbjT (DUF2867 family)
MKVAITGGTGFVGRHLTRALLERGHEVVLLARGKNRGKAEFEGDERVSFVSASLSEAPQMKRGMEGCEAVYNLAGINREKGGQTFATVHMEGTRNLMSVIRQAKIGRILHVSFLAARSRTDSPYHVSKWQAEETIKGGGAKYTIFRPGVIYGEGDQFLTNLKKSLKKVPVFGLVGFKNHPIAPLFIDDFTKILAACLDREDTFDKTYAVVGPEVLTLSKIVERVADTLNFKPHTIPLPVAVVRLAATAMEVVMPNPLLTNAQVTMLSEDLSRSVLPCDEMPLEFRPQTPFLVGKASSEKVERDIHKIAQNRGYELDESDIEV